MLNRSLKSKLSKIENELREQGVPIVTVFVDADTWNTEQQDVEDKNGEFEVYVILREGKSTRQKVERVRTVGELVELAEKENFKLNLLPAETLGDVWD